MENLLSSPALNGSMIPAAGLNKDARTTVNSADAGANNGHADANVGKDAEANTEAGGDTGEGTGQGTFTRSIHRLHVRLGYPPAVQLTREFLEVP
jgi:hypothetical protein